MNVNKLARFLGWFSVGLGLTELFAAEELGTFLGAPRRTGLLRLFGLRELAAGAGILLQPRYVPFWLWARVFGDALDLTALALASTPDNDQHENVLGSIGAVAGVTALDVYAAVKLTK